MPNPLQTAGAQAPKPTRYAPLFVNRFFTGLWTQRNPLRDAATPYLYEKFYSGARFDSIIDGVNIEVTPNLTLKRRPGLTVYNDGTSHPGGDVDGFVPIQRFYEFRQFSAGSESIKILADTNAVGLWTAAHPGGWTGPGVVYDATGPHTKSVIFEKNTGAGQTAFQAVGNTVFMGDGVDEIAWDGVNTARFWGIHGPIYAPVATAAPLPGTNAWAANTWYSFTLLVLDNLVPQNIQQLTQAGTTGAAQPAWNAALGGATNDGTAKWKNVNPAAWVAGGSYVIGDFVLGVTPSNPAGDFFKVTQAGTAGGSTPAWFSGVGNFVTDGTVIWQNVGPSFTWPNIGGVQLVTLDRQILDSNGNIQSVQSTGFSGGGVPTWNKATGAITIDNATSWLNLGPLDQTASFYAYAFRNSVTGHVSTASPRSAPIATLASSSVTVKGDWTTDPQVDTIRIYRTLAGGSTLFFLADIPVTSHTPGSAPWSYVDTTPDSGLNEFIAAAENGANNPPPVGLQALTFANGRIFGAVGNTVYVSGGPDTTEGSGNESFPPNNVFVFPSAVIRMWPAVLGIVVFTSSDIYLIQGQGTATSPLTAIPFLSGIGLAHYNSFDVNGSIGYLLTNDLQLMSFDPGSGLAEVGFPIGDKISAVISVLASPGSAYVTWHNGGSKDKALYLGFSSSGVNGGWFRMNQTSAPESGLSWSPGASVNQSPVAPGNGCSAIQSLETSPGVRSLLVGPQGIVASQHPILKRDLSVFSDTGTAYSLCYATLGSLVLAQPGQVAAVAFLTTDGPKLMGGATPTLGVWFDENSVVAGVPAATPLSATIQDPPLLAASTTFLSNRYYVSQTTAPAYCRHMQVKVDFGASSTAADELYSYSIYGAVFYDN